MMGDSIGTVVLASCTAFLYVVLAGVSLFYFLMFKSLRKSNRQFSFTYLHGRYDTPKMLFFFSLLISAIFDLPIYIACAFKGGPAMCIWSGLDFSFFHSLHLLALTGYSFSIVTPAVLWMDILNRKDGMLFGSQFVVDKTKRFFQLLVLCFMIMSIVIIATSSLQDGEFINATGTVLEPVLTFILVCGCLWSGIHLQMYVHKVRLGFAKELTFLLRLNVTMSIILITYLTRALFVLTLSDKMPSSYVRSLSYNYLEWLIFTHWLPYIFCSFCLINEMRKTGSNNSTSRTARTGELNHGGYIDRKDSHTSSFFSVYETSLDKDNSPSSRAAGNIGHGGAGAITLPLDPSIIIGDMRHTSPNTRANYIGRFGGAGESELTTNLLHDVAGNESCLMMNGSSSCGGGDESSLVAYSHNTLESSAMYSSDNDDIIYCRAAENLSVSRDDGDDMLCSFEQGQGGGNDRPQVRGLTSVGTRCDSDCGLNGRFFESNFPVRLPSDP